jgi:6-phosphogluconolactonase
MPRGAKKGRIMDDRIFEGLHSFEDAETLAHRAAEWLCERALATCRDLAMCLSGGSTPRRLYEVLAQPPIAARMPWSRIHWFFGDERFVPLDHPDSNFRMAREALLSRAPIPQANIHPVPTDRSSPQDAALAYEKVLKSFYGADSIDTGKPLFEVTLLGLGEDGHTASLFPGDPALQERRHWVVAVTGARDQPRVTLTYPALDSSAEAAFLVTGASKRDILGRVRRGDGTLPAARIQPAGHLHWFVDRAALPAC